MAPSFRRRSGVRASFGGVVLAVSLAASALVGACSSESTPPPGSDLSTPQPGSPGAGSSTPSDASSTDTGSPIGACNTIDNLGNLVDAVAFADLLPPGTGGTVVDGDYDLVDVTVYIGLSGTPGPTGVSYKSSISILDSVLQQVLLRQNSIGLVDAGSDLDGSTNEDAGPDDLRTTQAFSVNDTGLSTTMTCPNTGESVSFGFTATDTRLVLLDPRTSTSFTFEKRP